MGKEKNCSVQSVDRLFDIIEELSLYPRGMALSELSAAVGLTPSTTHRFLASLIARSYAAKDTETGKYRLTLRICEVSTRILPGLNILNLARPYMEKLAENTEEVIHLVTRVGDEILYLNRLDSSPSAVNMGSYAGLRNPMYCTGVGKSILAFLPDDEICQIWSRTPKTQFTPNTITDFKKMKSEIEDIRKKGWAVDDEEHELGIRCVAAPIFNFEHEPVAAISVSGTLGRMDADKIERIAPMVLSSTADISKLLGAGSGT